MAGVHLRGVKKKYGDLQVIHGIDMQIADGEFVVLVGPSGCGKSTLLRMVAGLEDITEGEIDIGGRVVNRLEPKDRDIAMVFQNYALYPHMSVYDNMAYGLKIRGLSKADIEARVQRAAAILQIEKFLDRKPRQLSGGQRQRVAMGRAIVRQPSVFLFDEPLSNLDAKLRVQMRLEIKKLHQNIGVTSIYVTHDQVEAMTLADRLVVMNAGVAEQIDTPIKIYERPATQYVAGFIGSPSMNFVKGRLQGAALLLEGGSQLALPSAFDQLNGRSVTLGVRPEHLIPADGGAAIWTAQADLSEELGADTLAHGKIGGADLVVRLPGHRHVTRGQSLPLTFDAKNIHLFDGETGRRIDP